MDTNWKKDKTIGKKIRAFCYRVIAAGALLVAILSGIMGREALANVFREGPKIILTGELYDLTEFRQYIAQLYSKAMIAYAGAGDDAGYPLTDSYALNYSGQMVFELRKLLEETGQDVIFYLQEGTQEKEIYSYDPEKNVAVSRGGSVRSNVSFTVLSEHDGHPMLPEGARLCCFLDGTGTEPSMRFFEEETKDLWYGREVVSSYYRGQYSYNQEAASQMRLVLAVQENVSSFKMQMMQWKAERYQRVLCIFFASVAVCLFFGILGLMTNKVFRTAREDYGKLSGRIWLEVKLVLIAGAVWLLHRCIPGGITSPLPMHMEEWYALWMMFPVGWLIYLLSIDLRQNAGSVFYNCLPVKCFCKIRSFIQSRPWFRRAICLSGVMLFGGLVFLGCGVNLFFLRTKDAYVVGGFGWKNVLALWGGAMLAMGLVMLYCSLRQIQMLKDVKEIVTRLSEIRQGLENPPLALRKNSLLYEAAEDVNQLEKGIENVLEQRNRSNRMRVELLTNVSHDLKTPLTSIINYADLLCEEELPASAAGYAGSLRDKAYRLKNMVQDVFELSKATSGNLPVEKNQLDLVKLIRQTLADMDEKIQESRLLFKLNISEEPLFIEADGEKLYRVFQNLFVNALQYSLEGSRIHIQLEKEGGYAVAKVKNTSRQELDFAPEEIVERFVRADSSRTTEGSGLGLSIVRSFTEACGGEFAIETDADMFTAQVRFLLAPAPISKA